MKRVQDIAFRLSALWRNRASITLPNQPIVEEAPMAQHISLFERLSVYIEAWENRTGQRIEREVEHPAFSYRGTEGDEKDKKVHVNLGSQFINFAKFLGSREYKQYVKDNPQTLSSLFDVMTKEEKQLYRTDND